MFARSPKGPYLLTRVGAFSRSAAGLAVEVLPAGASGVRHEDERAAAETTRDDRHAELARLQVLTTTVSSCASTTSGGSS